jgi:peroxiredoxin/predicted 2-oxoglutarate/Fe(II)-dependent dioxygenase YbiX
MADQVAYVNLQRGDPAPWFHQRSSGNPRYAFDTTAGRYIVLCFHVSAGDPRGKAAIGAALSRRELFDDVRFAFFGVSLDPRDESEGRVRERIPGVRFFYDFDGKVSRLYGAIPVGANPAGGSVAARRFWAVLDPTLRVAGVFPFADDGSEAGALFTFLDSLPPPAQFAGIELMAPILFLPDVFEPDLCRRLIKAYEAHGGEESGFMRQANGKTVMVQDHGHKRRRDHDLTDEDLIAESKARITRRMVPEIEKVHQFKVTRMERYIVSCYSAEDGGHFNAHRDNTTGGTAHRRFAVSINLNGDFAGGDLNFPEYGPRSFKPPPGGAVVFSCSLLHKASLVTAGRRFAFLPFLYDDAAAKIREDNNKFLGEGVGAYKN